MAVASPPKKSVKRNQYKRGETVKSKSANIYKMALLFRIKEFFLRMSYAYTEQSKDYARLILSVLLAITIFVALVFASIKTYQYLTTSDYFAITKIHISGNKSLTDDDILAITGLKTGNNILSYKINALKIALLENHWIDEVNIIRDLPGIFRIEIKEREPVFWVTNKDTLYYLDKNLNFIAPVSHEKFFSLPSFHLQTSDENAIDILPFFIDKLENAELPFHINDIAWFKITPLNNYEFFLEKHNILITVAVDDMENNMEILAQALSDLEKRKEFNKIKKITVIENHVTVVKN